ncbi:MAG: helix-turn-helix domain-containing protein [Planctomycetes bacterium]|nr:helix-turn-helix domain-containing protein [Planctomycetota bacterium]
MDLTTFLRNTIKRDGRSQYRLAKDAGIAVAVLQRFVSGERGITLDTASRLCKALGLELRPSKGSK